MGDNNIKYIHDSERNNNEFIEIYEAEIKRLGRANEELRALVEDKEQEIESMQQGKIRLQSASEQIEFLSSTIEQLEKQNILYQEKIVVLSSENANLTTSVEKLRQNEENLEEVTLMKRQLDTEKQKVKSLQDILEKKNRELYSVVYEQKNNGQLIENQTEFDELKLANATMKKQLVEEKAELAEMLLEARMQSKSLVDKAFKEAETIKIEAHKEVAAVREKASSINQQLEKIQEEGSQFLSKLLTELEHSV